MRWKDNHVFWKGTAIFYFKTQFQHSEGESEENHEKSQLV